MNILANFLRPLTRRSFNLLDVWAIGLLTYFVPPFGASHSTLFAVVVYGALLIVWLFISLWLEYAARILLLHSKGFK